MPTKTPRKGSIGMRSRSPTSPKTPGWVSGKDAIFLSPKSFSPKKPNTRRRTSMYQKPKGVSPEFTMPITQIISPKGVQTRSRRSSMFGVFKKGGMRLIDIPVTPQNKKISPVKTRARRSSIYQKDVKKESNRRASIQPRTKIVSPKPRQLAKAVTKKAPAAKKPPVRKIPKRTPVKTEVTVSHTVMKPVVHSPVVSLIDVISPQKQPSQLNTSISKSSSKKNESKVVLQSPSRTESQGKRRLENSLSDSEVNFKTPRVDKFSPKELRSVKRSAKRSARKTQSGTESPLQSSQLVGKTPKTETKETVMIHNEIEESMLIKFKTPGMSVKKSARKRKNVEKISPPSKKCILDLSPVEKLAFKTPHKLDKSPVLVLTRTPLADVFTSTPRETKAAKTPLPVSSRKTPLRPPVTSSAKKNLKQPRKSVTRTKRVSIVSDYKTPDNNRPSLISRRKATPAKARDENNGASPLSDSRIRNSQANIDNCENLTSLSDNSIKKSSDPLNVTLLSNRSASSIVSNKTVNTTSHSSKGRCTIL